MVDDDAPADMAVGATTQYEIESSETKGWKRKVNVLSGRTQRRDELFVDTLCVVSIIYIRPSVAANSL
jgi:hypothetical protein